MKSTERKNHSTREARTRIAGTLSLLLPLLPNIIWPQQKITSIGNNIDVNGIAISIEKANDLTAYSKLQQCKAKRLSTTRDAERHFWRQIIRIRIRSMVTFYYITVRAISRTGSAAIAIIPGRKKMEEAPEMPSPLTPKLVQ